jgi:flavin reductase (DIM6/NTAB) family NADH-FMN oxidoreductase RutF
VVLDKDNERADIMPLGWKMWTSAQPRMIAFSISREHYSHDLLSRERECVLAWPGKDMIDGVLICGSASGRIADKFALTGWKTVEANIVKAPLIEESVVNLECQVTDTISTGDHTLFVCSVVEGYVRGDETRIIFTLNDEAFFSHLGQGKGYKFGTFK